MSQTTIHLAIPAVGEYRKWAEITARSATKGSSLPVEVHYIDWSNVDRNKMERFGDWHGSAIIWSRLFLIYSLPDTVDWVISCDADVLFRGDIAKLWELKDDSKIVIGSLDSQPPWRPEGNPEIVPWCRERGYDIGTIICNGLVLVNLKRWRNEGIQGRVDAFIERHHGRVPYLDQTAFNVLFGNEKGVLPRQWGCFSGDTNDEVDYNGDCAIHFVGDVPWRRRGLTRLMSDAVVMWRREAGMSCGGWRRWLWLALRATRFFWRWNGRMAWHFRTALKKDRTI